VATSNNLSRQQFLRALAQKAGVPETVFATGAGELCVFRDQSFREGDL
jgi:AMMECR1 domain-containing protein